MVAGLSGEGEWFPAAGWLPAVTGGQAGKRREQRMNLGKAGWVGRLGSAYQLPVYLGMAERTPELRTQLRLRSCRCSVSVVEGLPPS